VLEELLRVRDRDHPELKPEALEMPFPEWDSIDPADPDATLPCYKYRLEGK
jgi:hypothetical protein